MKRGAALGLAAAILAAPGAVSKPAAGAPAPVPHPPPLSALPSIARVRIDVASDHIVAIEEVDVPRGDWRAGELVFYVAFGGPGAPLAFDARLLGVPDGALEPADSDVGEKLVTDRAAHRPAIAHELVGAEEMAGMVVHVPEATFRRAAEPGGMAALRLRTLLALPARRRPQRARRPRPARAHEDDPAHARSSERRGDQRRTWDRPCRSAPLRRGRRSVAARDWDRTEAGGGRARRVAGADSPLLAVRHPNDDLCIRFWVAQ